jgi:hypothetical protein
VELQILIEISSEIHLKITTINVAMFNENPIKIGKIIYGVFNKLYKLG